MAKRKAGVTPKRPRKQPLCTHPKSMREILAPGVTWCRVCGSRQVDRAWRRPYASLP